jgi:uncharacterized membrane protein
VTLLDLEFFYVAGAGYLAVVAASIARDSKHPTRFRSAAFWSTLAIVFGAGRWLPAPVVGYMVLVAVVLAAAKLLRVHRPGAANDFRTTEAARLGARLFAPALAVPVIVLILSFALPPLAVRFRPGGLELVKAAHVAQVALGVAAIAALGLALRVTGARRRSSAGVHVGAQSARRQASSIATVRR